MNIFMYIKQTPTRLQSQPIIKTRRRRETLLQFKFKQEKSVIEYIK